MTDTSDEPRSGARAPGLGPGVGAMPTDGSATTPLLVRAGSPLTWRVFLVVGAVVAGVLAATLVLLGVMADRTATVASATALDRTTRLVAVLLEGREGALTRGAQVFVNNPSIWPLVMQKRPEDLLDQSIEAAERIGASWVQFTDGVGVRLAKSDEPTAPRVPLSGSALIGGALEGRPTAGIGASADSVLFQAVAVPISPAGRIVGTMMAVQVVDSVLAVEVKRTTASEVVFYVLDTAGTPHVVASTVRADPALREFLAVFARDASHEEADAPSQRASAPREALELRDSVTTLGAAVELSGEHYVGRGTVLRSAGGEILGGVVALRSRDAEMAPYTGLRRWIVAAGSLGIVVAFILSFFTARSIARPVLALADVTRRAAAGDYAGEVRVRSNDEIGSLADAVRTMLADLREKQALVNLLGGQRGSPALAALSAVDREAPAPIAMGMRESRDGGASSVGVAEPIAPGRLLAGRYLLGEVLGKGGAGVVYRAFDRELGEVVALKTMRPTTLDDDPTALERLKSEIRLARRISHRNVVRTHDLGEAGGVYFITMEYVTGTSLRDVIDRGGPLPVEAVWSVGKQLCRALEVAHGEGIIHRDIKPQNLMIQPDGTLKVMDFGVARLLHRTAAMTRVGMVVGTPAYMAPEQLLDDPVDARADLYATGVVLYECLTGRRPIEADSPTVLIGRMLTVVPPAPRVVNPRVPASLSDVVMRALAKDPADRPSDAAELHELLVRAEA